MIEVDVRVAVADGRRRFALDATFSTAAGVAALYGPSGAGKSLTLQAVAGLLRPDAGRIAIGGRALFDRTQAIDLAPPARRIGYLFQHYALFPHLTVRQNVGFGLTSWRKRRLAPAESARINELLARFGLTSLADARPATLSGGQQQRVALARALACEPELLLLDEPFAALNPMLRADLRAQLREVRAESKVPMLMVSHDVEDVLALADVAFVYQDGRIVREVEIATGQARERAAQALGHREAQDTPTRARARRGLAGGPAAD